MSPSIKIWAYDDVLYTLYLVWWHVLFFSFSPSSSQHNPCAL